MKYRYLLLVLLAVVLAGCAVPRAVEQHHHHYYQADTMAVKAHVDRQMQRVAQMMDSAFSEKISEFTQQQNQTEQQHEVIQETITTTLDSLGREIRQEQRTISRDITREQQILEQRLAREYEGRLHVAVDSMSAIWQLRYDSLQTHVEQLDSALISKTPVGDARPWYRRWWSSLQWLLIGAVIALAVWLTRKWWIKLF